MNNLKLYCQKCGSPLKLEKLHTLNADRNSFLEGIGCSACLWGKEVPEERPIEAEFMQIALEQFGDDLDTIAVELQDMQQRGLFHNIF